MRMKGNRYGLFFWGAWVVLMTVFSSAYAQQHPSSVDLIRADVASGRLDNRRALLDEFRAAFRPELIPARYKPKNRAPIRCLTPSIMRYHHNRAKLSGSARQEIDGYLKVSYDTPADTLLSPSGRFNIIYTTSGADSISVTDADNSGVPDYAEHAAAYADSSWAEEVGRIGFTDPMPDRTSPYPIYIGKLKSTLYGFTDPDGNSSYIRIQNSYKNFPPNDDANHELGAMKVTIAHEFKHAIQYAANRWAGEIDQWTEMDATQMEEVVFDNVNDYYNYNRNSGSIFRHPNQTLYPGSYYHATWALYFTQRFGIKFWVDVWDDVIRTGSNLLPAMQQELQQVQGTELATEYNRSYLYHYASGANRTGDGYGFEEAANYPDPMSYFSFRDSAWTRKFDGVPTQVIPVADTLFLTDLTGNFLQITPSGTDSGPVELVVHYNRTGAGIGLLAYFKDGSSAEQLVNGQNADSLLISTNWRWENVDRLGLVVTNSDRNLPKIGYTLRFGSDANPIPTALEKDPASDLPSAVVLNQNYPNPFNPATTIGFALPKAQRVHLQVFDLTGRLVETLADRNYSAGQHRVTFNASSLSSGIYFYRLTTDSGVLTRKMTVLK